MIEFLWKKTAASVQKIWGKMLGSSKRSVQKEPMVHSTQLGITQGILSDFRALIEIAKTNETAKPHLKTLRHYASESVVSSYVYLFQGLLLKRAVSFDVSTGLDFGCWLGLSTFILKRLGAQMVYGADIIPEYITVAELFEEVLEIEDVEFLTIPNDRYGKVPLHDGSLDWIIANDLFSFANPSKWTVLISDAFRMLRRGGTLFLSDGNNPHNIETLTRLKETYYRYEVGDGSLEKPEGEFFKLRCQFIETKFSELAKENVFQLARKTAYLWNDEIVRHVRASENDANVAASLFQPDKLKVPIHPYDGWSAGAVTDPKKLIEMCRNEGFETEILFNLDGSVPYQTLDENLVAHGRFYIIGKKNGEFISKDK